MTQKELLTYPVVFNQISIQGFQWKGKERKGKEERKKSTENNTPPKNATPSYLRKMNQSIKLTLSKKKLNSSVMNSIHSVTNNRIVFKTLTFSIKKRKKVI